ncbi:MAG: hypothetical protein IJE17_04690 [Clostridia bacterium]|nr:hypothetical protein [Clostridia bacterium]
MTERKKLNGRRKSTLAMHGKREGPPGDFALYDRLNLRIRNGQAGILSFFAERFLMDTTESVKACHGTK